MSLVYHDINIPVDRSLTYEYVTIKQGDAGTHTLRAVLMANKREYIIPTDEGIEYFLKFKKPDKTYVLTDARVENNQIMAELTGDMLAACGTGYAEFLIQDGEDELKTATVGIKVVEPVYSEGDIESTSEFKPFARLLKDAAEATGNANHAAAEAREAADAANTAADLSNEKSALIPDDYADLIRDVAQTRQDAAETATQVDSLEIEQNTMKLSLADSFNGAYVENGALYFTHDSEVIAGPFSGFGGGGSGGSSDGNNAVLTVRNTSGWQSTTIAAGAECPIKLTWSSIEDENETGPGSLRIQVNGTTKTVLNVEQGEVSAEISEYLDDGSNTIKAVISDTYGNSRTINYNVTKVQISVSSSFDASTPYTDIISFPYTPVGNVSKTMHFILDGEEIGTNVTSASGRQLSFTVPRLAHGPHTFEAYFTCEINGQTVESNHLYYELICIEEGNTAPIIVSSFNKETAVQYSTLSVDYTVYDPQSMTADVTIEVNGRVAAQLNVDRTQQVFAYRADSVGALNIVITSGMASKSLALTVTEMDIEVEAETEQLALFLTSSGRSNNEADPAVWTYGDYAAEFANFNWKSDGWLSDEDGITVLRVAGDARVTIPYRAFAADFRGTGKTIELEFATRDVMDYDAVIMSCMSGGRGFALTAQMAALASEQSEISMQYKEEEHVRVTFVIEKRSENRLMYIYVNGIMSGVVQYPANDDFSQAAPADISIGSNECTIDLYNIRVYDNDLTRSQVLTNWIADTQDALTMLARYQRNDIYDEYGAVVISKLPSDLPYLIIGCSELPQYKGDKKTVSVTYVDPVNTSRSFTASGAQADVQGTSSQYYARKNYKIKFKNGFDLSNGTHVGKYPLRPGAIQTSTFCFKADVASSEGANNVELARLYNDTCPYKTVPQQEDSAIRQSIDGYPIVIFWNNGKKTTFLGKYNFNNDKGTEEVFGFAEGDESWEIRNNTSDRVLWKSADYESTVTDEDGKTTPAWLNDFEGRYPDGNEDPTNLKALAEWLSSTDQSAVSTDEEKAARLQKFKDELADHMEIDAVVFYYLFTELFLMVDSRAKNAFPSFIGGSKWFSLPYDFDTALGINNEGSLVFSYNLEDIDQVDGGADVFNGQQSVLWINLRQAFYTEIKKMYQTLRSTGALSYAKVESMFEEHQNKWGEAIFNEDAYFKYLAPLIEDGSGAYLAMLQGSKAEQRKWWLYNRFRYMDSKYNAGDALSDVIQLRGYAKADITVTPYADVYASVKYGSYLQQTRGYRNQAFTLTCPLDNVNDTEIYIYSASQLASVGDLSGLMVGYADFSMATKLQDIKLGSDAEGYANGNMKELYLGNNVLLRTLDVRNCTGLGQGDMKTVDISGCKNIEEVYFDGTAVTGVDLPAGGILKKLHLPATITNLTLRNQTALNELTIPAYSNISTLWIDNISDVVDSKAILKQIPASSRVRLVNVRWEASGAEEIAELFGILDTMRGLDEYGNNMDTAQVSGRIHVQLIAASDLAELGARYPYVTIDADHTSCVITYKSWDGSETIDTETILDGGNGSLVNSTPRGSTVQYEYTPNGWSLVESGSTDAAALTAVVADRTVYAAYSENLRSYTVTFVRTADDGGGTLQTINNVNYGTVITAASSYTGATPTTSQGSAEDYPFEGWEPASATVQGDTTFTAKFGSLIEVKEITDSWDTIITNIDNGTYADKYKIGNYKPLDLGEDGVINMQIVAMDADELTSGGRAPITFVFMELTSTDFTNLLPLFPDSIVSRMQKVNKTYTLYRNYRYVTYTRNYTDLWPLSARELGRNSYDQETSGVVYGKIYSDNTSRIKKKQGVAAGYDTRSAYTSKLSFKVNASGEFTDSVSGEGKCFGFCLGLEPETTD